MNNDVPEPLPSELERLFAIERPVPPATAALKEHVWAHLERTLGPGGGGPGSGSSASGVLGGLALLVAIGGGIVGLALLRRSSPLPPSPAPVARPTAGQAGRADWHNRRLAGRSSVSSTAQAAVPSTAGAAELALPSWFGQHGVVPRPIAGHVTVAGRPLPGATVRLESLASGPGSLLAETLLTDAQGGYRFTPAAAWNFEVSATLEGYAGAARSIDLRDPTVDTQTIDLELGPCALPITGRVLDAAGGVIAGAQVRHLMRLHFGPLATSAHDGSYQLWLPAAPARLRVDATGYGARVFEVPEHGGSLDLPLEPESLVIGTTLDETGLPLAGVQINAWPRDRTAAAASTVSDDNGVFQLGGLAPGHYRLNAWLRTGTTWVAIDVSIDAPGTVTPRNIQLSTTAELTGRVLRAGQPVAGAHVHALRGGDSDARSFMAVTQIDGTFTLHGASVGAVELLINEQSIRWLTVDQSIIDLGDILVPPDLGGREAMNQHDATPK